MGNPKVLPMLLDYGVTDVPGCSVALQNLGVVLGSRGEFARAESLYRAGVQLQDGNQSTWSNLLSELSNQGKMRERDSVLAVAAVRFPGSPTFNERRLFALWDDGAFDDALRGLDSARKAGNTRNPSWAVNNSSNAARTLGRFRDVEKLDAQGYAIDSAAGRPYPHLFVTSNIIEAKLEAGLPVDAELRALDADVEKLDLDNRPLSDRPYTYIAELNARAGRVDQARQILTRYGAAMAKDTAYRRWDVPNAQRAQAHVALSEKKWTEAAQLFRQGSRRADGPANGCIECLPKNLMRTFAAAGMADSAIAVYEAYRQTPWGGRPRRGPDYSIDGGLTEALAKMYDANGNTARAAELYRDFVELWKNADPELQPRVAAARARLKELGQVEKPR